MVVGKAIEMFGLQKIRADVTMCQHVKVIVNQDNDNDVLKVKVFFYQNIRKI